MVVIWIYARDAVQFIVNHALLRFAQLYAQHHQTGGFLYVTAARRLYVLTVRIVVSLNVNNVTRKIAWIVRMLKVVSNTVEIVIQRAVLTADLTL